MRDLPWVDAGPQIWSLLVEFVQICLSSQLPNRKAGQEPIITSRARRQLIFTFFTIVSLSLLRYVSSSEDALKCAGLSQIDLISRFRENYGKKIVCHFDRWCRFQRQNNCRSTVLHLIQPSINGHQTFNPGSSTRQSSIEIVRISRLDLSAIAVGISSLTKLWNLEWIYDLFRTGSPIRTYIMKVLFKFLGQCFSFRFLRVWRPHQSSVWKFLQICC